MESFVLVNGYVALDNTLMKIDNRKQSIKNDLKSSSLIIIVGGIIIFNLFKKYQFSNGIETFKSLFYLGLQLLGIIGIIMILYYAIFKKKWSNNISIRDIAIIEIDNDDDFEHELTVITTNRREKILNFRKLEHQLEPFLEAIKKKNSRITVKYT